MQFQVMIVVLPRDPQRRSGVVEIPGAVPLAHLQ